MIFGELLDGEVGELGFSDAAVLDGFIHSR